MNRAFLAGLQRRKLTSTLTEVSAFWKVAGLWVRDGETATAGPRVETDEERDEYLEAVGVTLDSLRSRAPYCHAVVGLGALQNLPAESREATFSVPHEEIEVEWAPGDEDFAVGGSLRSLIVDFGRAGPVPLYPCFHGIDPRCLVLFGQTRAESRALGTALAGARGHRQALGRILTPETVAVYPALDADAVVFVTRDGSLLSFVLGDDCEAGDP